MATTDPPPEDTTTDPPPEDTTSDPPPEETTSETAAATDMSPTQQQSDSTQPQELAAIGSSTDEQLSEEKPESPTTATPPVATSPVATVPREEAPHPEETVLSKRLKTDPPVLAPTSIPEVLFKPDWAPKSCREVIIDRIRGCIYGNALGDAMGLATEFMSKVEAGKCYKKAGPIQFSEIVQDFHR